MIEQIITHSHPKDYDYINWSLWLSYWNLINWPRELISLNMALKEMKL